MERTYFAKYQIFIRRLKQARLDAGLSQVQVANRLGEKQSYVEQCESARHRVDITELAKFANIYGKNLAYFAEGFWTLD